jgi:hypothetical protein
MITSTHHASFVGDFRADIPFPERISLEGKETSLEGESQRRFLTMMQKMLQWDPSKRSSAKALAEDEWIMEHM